MGLEGSDGSTQKRAKECGFDFYSVCSAHFPGNCRDCTENCLNEMKNNIKPKIFEGKRKLRKVLKNIYAHCILSAVKKIIIPWYYSQLRQIRLWFKERRMEEEAACALPKDARTHFPCKLTPKILFSAAHLTAAKVWNGLTFTHWAENCNDICQRGRDDSREW